MIRKTKKEVIILAGLLTLLSISIFSQFSNESEIPARPIANRLNIPANPASNEVLAVDLLTTEAPEFSGVKRNIFQFGSGARPVQPQEKFVPEISKGPIATTEPTIPDVHYLGFYYEKETGLKMASLSNSGRVYVGKTGQILGGKYQVQEIAADHVILKLLLQKGKFIRVPLGRTPASYTEWNEVSEQ